MKKITTSSGFKCEVNSNVTKDWRFMKALGKCQHNDTALDGAIEVETALLGAKGAEALEKHLEELDGFVSAEKLFAELTEILSALDDSKN